MSTLAEKIAQAERFLSELGRGIPEDQRVMVGYSSEATSQKGKNGKINNSGWKPLPHRIDREIEIRKNCYVCISASRKTPHPFYDGTFRYWRGEDSFGHGLALMVDDIGTGTGSKGGLTLAWFASRLPPTVIVETSPGNHQLWYFLDTPCPNMAYFRAFLVAFADQVLDKGGDHTIRDVSRYGRLPCGINNKRKPDSDALKYGVDGQPFQVSLVCADYGRRYSIERIGRAFQLAVIMPRRVVRDPLAARTASGELPVDYTWLGMLVRELSRMKQGEYSGGEVRCNASGRYRIRCPFSHLHSSHDAYGAYFRGPVSGGEYDFVAGCSHDTCRKGAFRWGWSALVDLVLIGPAAAFLADLSSVYASKDFAFYQSVFLPNF